MENAQKVVIAPMQWSELNDIHDVKPVNDEDAECLAEIAAVLRKHNNIDRFGVHLLHSHFDLKEHEVLLEVSDTENRVLSIRPVSNDNLTKSSLQTQFRFIENGTETLTWCEQRCAVNIHGNHSPAGHTPHY
jgi:hypothetical protein